jgi:putative ABC transport system substrate-binding protein
MWSRRATLKLAAGLASVPLVGRAQEPYTIFQITFRGETEVERGFRDYLEQRGIPVNIIHRSADLDPSRVPKILEEVREVQPDLVYSWGTPVTIATFGRYDDVDPERHITDIPGVFTLVSAPVRSGVVPSFESSGRNITGCTHVVPPEPQVRAMQAYKPFDRLGVLYTPNAQNTVAIMKELRRVADAQGFSVVERTFPLDESGQPQGEPTARLVRELAEEGAEWLYYIPDTFLSEQMDVIAPVATELGVPGFSTTERTQYDSLISLVGRYYSLGQLTAYKAEQILVEGRDPASIPIETLKRFALIINMPLAREMELYPPLGMLSYANVITD